MVAPTNIFVSLQISDKFLYLLSASPYCLQLDPANQEWRDDNFSFPLEQNQLISYTTYAPTQNVESTILVLYTPTALENI